MSTPELVVPRFINLKNHSAFTENWLHQRLIDNPSLLGLGDLEVRDSERKQPRAGRLDLLLHDPDSSTRYEVEIQLGSTDESHLVRTIEYWDIERRRYPQYEHIAVIVGEDITSRFLNVISLFNGFIPLIAIQLRGVEVNGAFTLIATRVLDIMPLGTDEEDEGETVDRAAWQRKASLDSLKIMDSLVDMIRKLEPNIGPKYNKHYIGLAPSGGTARNFVIFRPRRFHVLTEFKIPQNEELTNKLDESGLALVAYDSKWGAYRIRVRQTDLEDEERSKVLTEFIIGARDAYVGNS